MQKGRILLVLFIFPIISIAAVFFLWDNASSGTSQQVLAAKTINITLTPTAIIISNPSPTSTLTPTPSIGIKKARLAPNPSFSPLNYILDEINSYRQTKGLSRVSSNTETCSFAKVRAEEISNSFTHDGFNKRVTDKNLPYPSYQEVTENIAYNTDYTDVVKRWIASPGHEENMRKDTPFICVARSGDYYAFEGWRP